MKNYVKDLFALTDNGARDTIKATLSSLWVYFINMVPPTLLLFLMDELLLQNIKNPLLYISISIITLIVMWYLLKLEYTRSFNATYKESASLRLNIADTLRKLPLSYFSKHNLSDLAQTIMTDVAAIEHALSHSIPKMLAMTIFFPIILILSILGNLILGLAVMVPTILSVILLFISKKNFKTRSVLLFSTLRDISDSYQESIELQKEIASFNLQNENKRKINGLLESSENIRLSNESLVILIVSLSDFLSITSIGLVLVIGINHLINGQINILYLLGYLLLAIKMRDLVAVSKEGILETFHISSSIERIKEIQNIPHQTGNDIELKTFDIEFKNVSFSYSEDTKVLDNISFTAKQNEVTALVGTSGSGKTSIFRIISRLYDHNSGEILVGGVDIKEISTQSLFNYISMVFQDVTLFDLSVMDNIRIGKIDASDEEVIKAAQLANCMDFIEKLPDGFNTKIGENGAELSGGERQRLSIARAFLKNAPILLLDEIASSLDVDNEKKIQESLNKLIENKTVLIISHRLKSIQNVDKIVVINDGTVERIGKHDDLISSSPSYNNLIVKSKLTEEFVY
ncbi:ABC transporter ATP-binding protein [Taylorella equigenitalis]|uniref:ABC transporter, ATP-binding/permease protein n=1 Tax=Taylorella equigenitalis (strain MCE9) TaxID=937774 RepID=A0A654KII1_TAYEM|nr:ABC transporter ATP-binding protein [Taylorella equigenitalis]ADU92222.1 ABC transporter, ATP-binding/permease protein [Taylorella equigenitalis MCE9]ASY37726.1 ABC transporter ATP-binding protein [Taylorella equigenitalis]ASY40711.1 ABC transporter ATP-binding protein [Taylorella equigenitalis]ASY42148.1 ABC transporter ATP-binding protein [Taylorella equigenitalis]KGK33298.1 ABC transporter ATP-binding protein [Taylorella equigenitalis]